MLVRLIILLFMAALGYGAFRAFRGHPWTRISPRWRLAAVDCPPLARALEIRRSLARLLVKRGATYGQSLLSQVDGLLASMVDLADARAELTALLADGDNAPLGDALRDVDARLSDAMEQVQAAFEHLAGVAGRADPEVNAARDRLTRETDRLRTSLRAYEEARREAEADVSE